MTTRDNFIVLLVALAMLLSLAAVTTYARQQDNAAHEALGKHMVCIQNKEWVTGYEPMPRNRKICWWEEATP